MKNLWLLLLLLIVGCNDENLQLFKIGDGATDVDGNNYESIILGDQEWLASNLRTTKYSNGILIYNVTDVAWGSQIEGSWCYYNNDPLLNDDYGKLYNWFAIDDTRNICPSGWHVPDDYDWATLENYLGGNEVTGGKMKEKGTEHWNEPNTGATNKSGFNGVAGGNRRGAINSVFETFGTLGRHWSATPSNDDEAWGYDLSNENSALTRNQFNKTYGFSCRCVKD